MCGGMALSTTVTYPNLHMLKYFLALFIYLLIYLLLLRIYLCVCFVVLSKSPTFMHKLDKYSSVQLSLPALLHSIRGCEQI